MRKLVAAFLLTVFILAGTTFPALSEVASAREPQVQGEGAYLIDALSGQALYVRNPDKPLAPASTTKIMTGLLALEKGNLNDTVTASKTMEDSKWVYGTEIYLVPGEKLSMRDMLYALLLNSANDAAVAIAEHIGGGDLQVFVDLMNERAQEIGANQTHFVNPSGLTDAGQVTTAHDLALIARVACQNPAFAEYVRTKTHTISRSQPQAVTLMVNQNKLLSRDDTVDGVKTGYTAAAQNCLVASSTREGRKLIGVILKSPGPEIYTDMQAMFEYGFSQYKDVVYKPAGSVLSTVSVNNEMVDLVIDRPIYMSQKLSGPGQALNLRVVYDDSFQLNSVQEGQVVGQVEVLDGEAVVEMLPLKSARTVWPPVLHSGIFSNHSPLFTGFLFFAVAAVFLLIQKKYTNWRGRRPTRFPGRRESNS